MKRNDDVVRTGVRHDRVEINHECLKQFFIRLGECNFDTAKSVLEKELKGGVKNDFYSALQNLCICEKYYMGLNFTPHSGKWTVFGRRDLRDDYKKIDLELIILRDGSRSRTVGSLSVALVGHLCSQLLMFTEARTNLMSVYETLCSAGESVNSVFETICSRIIENIEVKSSSALHPLMEPLFENVVLEKKLIESCILTSLHLSKLNFLQSVLHIYEAHEKSVSLEERIVQVKAKGIFSSSNPSYPPLLLWLTKFKLTLLSKFSVYFYNALSQNALEKDLKETLSRLGSSNDCVSRLKSFRKSSLAHSVSIILINPEKHEYCSSGYCVGTGGPIAMNISRHYEVVFAFPIEPPAQNTIDMISAYDRSQSASLSSSPPAAASKITPSDIQRFAFPPPGSGTGPTASSSMVSSSNSTSTSTVFFAATIESDLLLVAYFDWNKQQDSAVTTFFHDTLNNLNLTNILTQLRQAVKA